MKKLSLALLLALPMAVCGCAHQVPAYVPTPRPQIPELPADLSSKQDASYCLELLAAFSMPPEDSQKVCAIAMP